MKLLKRTSLSILTILFLTCLSSQEIAQAGQDSIRAFNWEGLSLSLTSDQMVSALEADGYTQLRVTEGKKKISSYQRKTKGALNKVQIIEKNGVLTKISFSERRVGGKKNLLSTEAADSILESIKAKLGIDDSFCTPGTKGGGRCLGQTGTATHANEFNVNVTRRVTKIALTSKPISQAVMDANTQKASGLASAYGCLGTIDINSVKEIYECIDSVSKELEVLDKAKKINRSKHMPVYLSSPTTPCWQLSNFYKRGLSFLKSDSDIGPIPNCATFAAVIKLAAGSPPFWSGCMNEDKSDEFLKSCIDGVNPTYFKLVNQRIPSCKEYQLAYQRGIVASQDTAINVSAVTPPECEHVIAFAKSFREPLTEELLVCAGYDPDNAREHISKCITTDRDLWLLNTCGHVQAIYRRKIIQSNYGYLPDNYRPITCDQTKDLIAKADTVRVRLKEEAAEERRLAILRRENEENIRKGYMSEEAKEALRKAKKRAEKRYGETPEKEATRTSKLEKEIKANGGNIKLACKALGRKNIFCPPTLEEIRLAMMRNHAKIANMRMIDGHMLHGSLIGAKGELNYREPKLLRECRILKRYIGRQRNNQYTSSYDCFFVLQIKGNVYTVSVSGQLRYVKRYDYDYNFRIGEDGLWQAEGTAWQRQKDQKRERKNQARRDYEEEEGRKDQERAQRDLDGLQNY